MTLEKASKIVDDICYSIEECHDCPFGIKSEGQTICAYDRVWDVVSAEEEKEDGFCEVVLPSSKNTIAIKEEDMDAVMAEITAYRLRKEK